MMSDPKTERETLIAKVRRDIGTVRSVAQRRSNPDRDHRMMIDRLIQWEDELLASLPAAPAPEGETATRLREAAEWLDRFAKTVTSSALVERLSGYAALCHEVANQPAPASPAPTPEGRETALLMERGFRAAIREAKAETLREVAADISANLYTNTKSGTRGLMFNVVRRVAVKLGVEVPLLTADGPPAPKETPNG
jgi:hypothetical protein